MNQSPNDTLKPVFILPYSIVALAVCLPASPPFCLPLLTNMMRGLSKAPSLCYTELIIILLACMMEQQLLLLVLVPLGDCRRTPCMDWPFDSRYLLCVCVFGIKFFGLWRRVKIKVRVSLLLEITGFIVGFVIAGRTLFCCLRTHFFFLYSC